MFGDYHAQHNLQYLLISNILLAGHCGSLQGYDIRREAVELTVAHYKAMPFVVKQ